MFSCRAAWLLIKAQDIATWVAKTRSDFRRITANWLHNFSSVRPDCVQGGSDTIDHDVDQQSGNGRWRPAQHPRPADLANRVVERNRAVAALPNAPAENFFVELG